jgi:hypothetical protein
MESAQGSSHLTSAHASVRRDAGVVAAKATLAFTSNRAQFPVRRDDFDSALHYLSTGAATYGVYGELLRKHGFANVQEVPQNHKKWVR